MRTPSAANPGTEYNSHEEQWLLELANQARAQAGLAPLRMDEGLARAARKHSALMAARNQLSHDLAGEPALPLRLAATSALHLSGEGENVGYTESVAAAHRGFMRSPPHRANLLDPDFNVVGFGIVHRGNMVYVTQDFGHSLPGYSGDQAKELVARTLQQNRVQAGQAELQERPNPAADSAACAMAQAGALNTPAPPARYTLRYTTLQ